jgi:hypothetical protein
MPMARLVEIIGERQDSCPAPSENDVEQPQQDEEKPTWAREHLPQPGACESPLRMRLHDFSGEGERAPPGYRRWGERSTKQFAEPGVQPIVLSGSFLDMEVYRRTTIATIHSYRCARKRRADT